MPLLRFDLIAGRTDGELKDLLDAAHRAIVEAACPIATAIKSCTSIAPHALSSRIPGPTFRTPTRSSCSKSPAASARRSKRRTSTASSVRSLRKACGISSSDVVVSFVENGDEDWSFGLGRAQFLTGDL